MPPCRVGFLAVFLCLAWLCAAPCVCADDAGLEFFEKRIRPALVKHCYSCHSADAKNLKGGLRLDSKSAILAGGDSGKVVVPGKPGSSLLFDAVSYSGEFSDMPPAGKLPDRVIADFQKWIKLGLPIPEDQAAGLKPKQSVDINKGREFWSFQPATTHPLPNVKKSDWPTTRLDHFVLRKLEEKQLHPAEDADRRTLIRRLSFDLTGLPPTLEEIERFENDQDPAAYERLVDRLLASPHYGERWGRHWLDVARYAEDNPTSESTCKPPPYPWPYRDWVIRALNDDLGYDEFLRRQLAADLMELPPAELAATGFLGLSPVYHKEPKLSAEVISVIVADEWDERLDTITRGFLGLTVACARCHDHKFDPIATEDYYALAGVIAGTQLVEWPLAETGIRDAELLTETREAIVDYQLRVSYAKNMQDAARIENRDQQPYIDLAKKHQATLDGIKKRKLFQGPIANVVRDAGIWVNGDDPDWTVMDYRPGQSRDLPVFIRGNPNNPGKIVPRRFLEVFSSGKPKLFGEGSGRLELAEAILNDAQSLTARVIVNRIWGWHFGQGLVATPSNFGALGDRPSHLELLDDLAARFIENGWSLKWLHREIVTSAAYRQSSVGRNKKLAESIDPENRLFWKMNRRRLDPEIWRDSVLWLSRELEQNMFGQSQSLDDARNHRRAVYGTISRQRPAAVLQLFDFPDAKRHADQRLLTTTPLQQLYLLNGPFLERQAEELASGRVGDKKAAIESLFKTILQRSPTPRELQGAAILIESAEGNGLTLLAHSLLASNEFLFID